MLYGDFLTDDCVKIIETVSLMIMLNSLNKRIKRKKEQFGKLASKLPLIGPPYFFSHTEEGIKLSSMLLHKNSKGYPVIKLSITKEIEPTKEDLKLTERLLKVYKRAIADRKKSSYEDMWTFLAKGPHSSFFNLLKRENTREIAFYLCNMSRMGITHGITQGEIEFKKIASDSVYRRWLGLFILDELIALAEAFGVITLENPEQGNYGMAIFSDIDEIVKKIENFLGIYIIPPSIEGGAYGIKTKKGDFHYKDVASLYVAWRCRKILKNIQNPSVCEIGAGNGKTAYYSNLLGIKLYTIIDLPHINILQGFYLIKSLPKEKISLYGEKNNGNISILPDFAFAKTNCKFFDLTLNQDSFPEIDRKTVLDYLSKIKLYTKNLFLSINQESQNTMMIGDLKQHVVSELVSEVKEFEKVYRFSYWLRKGYVEELYKILN